MTGIAALLIFWKVLVGLAAHCREAIVDSCYSPSTALCLQMGSTCVLDPHVWGPGNVHWIFLVSPWYHPATPFLDSQFPKPRYNKKILYILLNHSYFYLYLQLNAASSIPKQNTSKTLESSRKTSYSPKKVKVDMAFVISINILSHF